MFLAEKRYKNITVSTNMVYKLVHEQCMEKNVHACMIVCLLCLYYSKDVYFF